MKLEQIKFYFFSLCMHAAFNGSYGLKRLKDNAIAMDWIGEIGILSIVLFYGSAIVFYFRPDLLFFSYRMRLSIIKLEPYFSGELLRGQFWLYKIFLWLFLPVWPVALVIFGKQLPWILPMYILMWFGIFTIVNIEMLFISYSKYLDKRAMNQLGIHRIWGWK